MSRLTKFITCLAAVAAVFAALCGSASAHRFVACETRALAEGKWSNNECTARGGTEQYATRELASEELEGEAFNKETNVAETQELIGELAKEKIIIACSAGKVESGTAKSGGKVEATLEYSQCGLFSAANGKLIGACKVEPITASVKGELEGSGEPEIKFEPKTGSIFAEITINNVTGKTCVEKISKATVTGTQRCELLPWWWRRLYSIHCLASGSSLTFASAPATYRGLLWLWLRRLIPWGIL